MDASRKHHQLYDRLGIAAAFAVPTLMVVALGGMMMPQRLEAVIDPLVVGGSCVLLASVLTVACLVFGYLSRAFSAAYRHSVSLNRGLLYTSPARRRDGRGWYFSRLNVRV